MTEVAKVAVMASDDLEFHPTVALNRIPGEEVERMTARKRPQKTKGALDWRAMPNRHMVDEGEDPHVFGMVFTALCGVTVFFAVLGLSILGGVVLVQSVRHAAHQGGSIAAFLHAFRARVD